MIKPLTSFRFIAALIVFLVHLDYFTQFNNLKAVYNNFFSGGYLGVSFFFALSGFILTLNYHKIFNTINKVNLFNFYLNRLARIYPVHLLTFFLSLGIVVTYAKDGLIKTIVKAIVNLGLLQTYIPVGFYSFNGPSWSLSVEMFCYVLFPFLICFVQKNNFIKKNVITVMFVLYVIALVFVFMLRDFTFSTWLFYVFPPFRLLDFSLGALVALVFIDKGKFANKINIQTSTILEITSLLLLILALYFSPYIHSSFKWGIYYLPFMVFIIYVFSFQSGLVSKLLSSRVLNFLGEISFAFYMTHFLIIKYSLKLNFYHAHPIINSILCFLIALIVSSLIYKLFEIRARDSIKGLGQNKFNKKIAA